MGPPLSPGLPPGQNLDEEVWMPHTKSCLFHRNSRCEDLRCLHPLIHMVAESSHSVCSAHVISAVRYPIMTLRSPLMSNLF
jgi:hypothetical protein